MERVVNAELVGGRVDECVEFERGVAVLELVFGGRPCPHYGLPPLHKANRRATALTLPHAQTDRPQFPEQPQ